MSEFRFSRRTVIAAIEMLERLERVELTRYLLKLAPDLPDLVRSEKVSVSECLNNLIRLTDQWPDRETDDGQLFRDALIEKAVTLVHPAWPDYPDAAWETFQRALELDGFVITDGMLRRTLPADVGLPTAESETTRLLQKHGLTTAKGHLDQALDAHGRGDWAAANSQIRTFFDSLLDDIVEKLDATAATLGTGQLRRAKLAALGFLTRHLNEWDDEGRGFISGLVRRLHPQGAHPGLSDEEDSTFRLHVVLLTGRLLLTRFDAQVGS
jgi:hypothetical protein